MTAQPGLCRRAAARRALGDEAGAQHDEERIADLKQSTTNQPSLLPSQPSEAPSSSAAPTAVPGKSAPPSEQHSAEQPMSETPSDPVGTAPMAPQLGRSSPAGLPNNACKLANGHSSVHVASSPVLAPLPAKQTSIHVQTAAGGHPMADGSQPDVGQHAHGRIADRIPRDAALQTRAVAQDGSSSSAGGTLHASAVSQSDAAEQSESTERPVDLKAAVSSAASDSPAENVQVPDDNPKSERDKAEGGSRPDAELSCVEHSAATADHDAPLRQFSSDSTKENNPLKANAPAGMPRQEIDEDDNALCAPRTPSLLPETSPLRRPAHVGERPSSTLTSSEQSEPQIMTLGPDCHVGKAGEHQEQAASQAVPARLTDKLHHSNAMASQPAGDARPAAASLADSEGPAQLVPPVAPGAAATSASVDDHTVSEPSAMASELEGNLTSQQQQPARASLGDAQNGAGPAESAGAPSPAEGHRAQAGNSITSDGSAGGSNQARSAR